MSESIYVFSVIAGPAGARIPTTEFERRANAIRREIFTLIPAAKFLVHSVLQECMTAEGDKLILSFNLVESAQSSFLFETDSSTYQSSLVRLFEDANRLRESAEHTQIRIGELVHLFSPESSGTKDGHPSLPTLDQEQISLMRLIHTNRGRNLRLRFPDNDLIFQFPDLPVFIPEQNTRTIRALVSQISSSRASLTAIQEIELNESLDHRQPLPKKITIMRPRSRGQSILWVLLHMATDRQIFIEAEVRVALRPDNYQPGQLELIWLKNIDLLKSELFSWVDAVISD